MMSLPLRLLFAEVLRRPAKPSLTAGQAAVAFLQKIRINGRRFHTMLLVLLTAGLALFFVSRFAVTEVVLWPEWSANAARAFIVVGPVFAAWTAMLVSRDGSPLRAEILAATATSRIRRELNHAALGVLAALACYCVVVACVLGYAARHATWGGPDWWVVLFGAVMIALHPLVGWLMGLLAPTRLTPVVAGGATFLYTVVSYAYGMSTSGLDAVQPWRYIEGRWALANRMFYDASPYVGMPHPAGGVLIGVGAGALLIAGHLWARQAGWGVVVALAAGVLLLVPGWVLASSTEEMPREAPALVANPPMSCGGEVVEICLHKAYEAQLADGVAFAEAFYAPVAGLPGVPERITQQLLPEPPEGTLSLSTSWTNTPIEQVLALPMGEALVPGAMEPGFDGFNASQHAILTWLTERAGGTWVIGRAAEIDYGLSTAEEFDGYRADVDAAADRFAGLSPDEQRAWLEANWDPLRAGELSLEDLP